jgi:DNA replication licensing factor MCM5
MPDKVKCHDFQILKLQEAPDSVPHGEMPRHMQLFVDRFLCDRVVPGNRVTVLGIYSIKKTGQVLQSVYSRKLFIFKFGSFVSFVSRNL